MIKFLESIFGCFHKWSKWEYDKHMSSNYTTGIQVRTCEKCKKMQSELI